MIWIIGGAVIFGIVCWQFISYNKYRSNYNEFNENAKNWHDKTVELTFDEVMKYSDLKPEKWTLAGDVIHYKIGQKNIIGEDKFYVYFGSYKDYVKYVQWWKDKKLRAKQEAEIKMGLEFCNLMKEDCKIIREKSQEEIRKATAESARLIKQAIESDADLNHNFKCLINDNGAIEIIRCDNKTKTMRLTHPEGSITCG